MFSSLIRSKKQAARSKLTIAIRVLVVEEYWRELSLQPMNRQNEMRTAVSTRAIGDLLAMRTHDDRNRHDTAMDHRSGYMWSENVFSQGPTYVCPVDPTRRSGLFIAKVGKSRLQLLSIV